jgi:hypothetical protein
MFAMTALSVRAGSFFLVLISILGCGRTSEDAAATVGTSAVETGSSPSRAADRGAPATIQTAIDPPPTVRPEPVFRPDDDWPRHDDAALERAGIRKYGSRRLVLYTDIDERKAVRLPPLVDALYDELVAYFGELPPARDGSEWQITGFVMRDPERFTAAGLVPSTLPRFNHGLNRRRRFWMHEQSFDYYNEHLLLHEAIHCFMTTLPVLSGPAWYMEGMAEHFATHRTLPGGNVEFGIIPATPGETQGFDRVTLIRKEVDAGRTLSLDDVFAISDASFAEPLPYAWAWAACHFLDSQPDYRGRFRELSDVALRGRFREEFELRFSEDADLLEVRWQLFVRTMCFGYDTGEAVLAIDTAKDNLQEADEVKVRADAGWQSMRLRLKEGATYELTAQGQVSLAASPEPWTSDANGITIEYAAGKPLGRLIAAVVGDDLHLPAATQTLFDPIDVGGKTLLTAPIEGTLYLRINDRWDSLSDNDGELTVHVRQIDD